MVTIISLPCSRNSLRLAISNLQTCIDGKFYEPKAIEAALGTITESSIRYILLSLLDRNPQFFIDIDSLDIEDFFRTAFYFLSEALVSPLDRVVPQCKASYNRFDY